MPHLLSGALSSHWQQGGLSTSTPVPAERALPWGERGIQLQKGFWFGFCFFFFFKLVIHSVSQSCKKWGVHGSYGGRVNGAIILENNCKIGFKGLETARASCPTNSPLGI